MEELKPKGARLSARGWVTGVEVVPLYLLEEGSGTRKKNIYLENACFCAIFKRYRRDFGPLTAELGTTLLTFDSCYRSRPCHTQTEIVP